MTPRDRWRLWSLGAPGAGRGIAGNTGLGAHGAHRPLLRPPAQPDFHDSARPSRHAPLHVPGLRGWCPWERPKPLPGAPDHWQRRERTSAAVRVQVGCGGAIREPAPAPGPGAGVSWGQGVRGTAWGGHGGRGVAGVRRLGLSRGSPEGGQRVPCRGCTSCGCRGGTSPGR